MSRKDSKGRVLKTGESQRKNGTYEYKFTDRSGKRRSVYAKDLKTLREKEKEIQKDIEANINLDRKGMTLDELISEYLSKHKNVRSNTIYRQNGYYGMLRNYSIMSRRVKDLTVADCKSLVIELNQQYADGTVRQLFSLCKRSMDYAVEANIVSMNPFLFSTKSLLIGKMKPKEVFTDKEFEDLIQTISASNIYKWYVPHLRFLRATGLRISEFIGLRVQDIDFENRQLSVRQQVLVRTGSYKEIYFSPLKTKASKAVIPLSPVALESIKEIMDNGYRFTLPNEQYDKELSDFFVSTRVGNFLAAHAWDSAFDRVAIYYNKKHPETPIHLYPHKMRHTAATKFLEDGLSVTTTQKLIRHASATITLDVYTHMNSGQVQKEFESIYPPDSSITTGI